MWKRIIDEQPEINEPVLIFYNDSPIPNGWNYHIGYMRESKEENDKLIMCWAEGFVENETEIFDLNLLWTELPEAPKL